MNKIVISSTNPVKVNATSEAFKTSFPDEKFEVEAISVESNVSNQPMSEQETMNGALNRVNNAQKLRPEADYWVGIEGGIQRIENSMITFAWVVVKNGNKIGKGRSASFFLPAQIVDLINQGKELGDADDVVFGKSNSKQQNGAVGILTQDLITRTSLYVPAIILALIPFKNNSFYT